MQWGEGGRDGRVTCALSLNVLIATYSRCHTVLVNGLAIDRLPCLFDKSGQAQAVHASIAGSNNVSFVMLSPHSSQRETKPHHRKLGIGREKRRVLLILLEHYLSGRQIAELQA